MGFSELRTDNDDKFSKIMIWKQSSITQLQKLNTVYNSTIDKWRSAKQNDIINAKYRSQ